MEHTTQQNSWEVIINPVSGGKKAPGLWKKIKAQLDTNGVSYQENITQHSGHAIEITKAAISDGARNILIVGGDGTANEVVNGIFMSGMNTNEITIAMASAGTGNDWVRTTGTFRSIPDIPERLKRNESFEHDAACVEFKKNGSTEKRYFINICGLGFDGLTAKKVAEGGKFMHGSIVQYWLAIFRSLFTYKHSAMEFRVDGKATTLNTLSVAAGICRYNGGGMMQLPNAEFNDGLLDMTVIGDMSKLKMVMSLPKLTDGSFLKMKEITTFRGKEIIIKSEQQIFVEADGEYLGETPVAISILPSALRILNWE